MTTAGHQVKAPLGWAPGLGSAPALTRLLALWSQGAAAPAAGSLGSASAPMCAPPRAPVLAEQLGACLSWVDAVALSQALAQQSPLVTQGEPLSAIADWAGAALARVRVELQAGFQDRRVVGEPQSPAQATVVEGLPPYRLHHAQQQRAIAVRVNGLRERLRAKLSGSSERLARLAALDAVFERALLARERQGLAGLPVLMGQRATRLETEHGSAWPTPLWAELQQALHAELELRLQPVLGLIEALHDEAGLPAPTTLS